jgi:hypothetical protein
VGARAGLRLQIQARAAPGAKAGGTSASVAGGFTGKLLEDQRYVFSAQYVFRVSATYSRRPDRDDYDNVRRWTRAAELDSCVSVTRVLVNPATGHGLSSESGARPTTATSGRGDYHRIIG